MVNNDASKSMELTNIKEKQNLSKSNKEKKEENNKKSKNLNSGTETDNKKEEIAKFNPSNNEAINLKPKDTDEFENDNDIETMTVNEREQTNDTKSLILEMPGHTVEQITMFEKEKNVNNNNPQNSTKYKHLTELNMKLAFEKHKYGTSFGFDKTTILKLIFCLCAFYLFFGGIFIIEYFQQKYKEIRILNSFFMILFKLLINWITVFFCVWCLYIILNIIISSRRIVKLGSFIEFSLASFEMGIVLFFSVIVFERIKKICFPDIIDKCDFQFIDYKYVHYWEKCIKIFLNSYLNNFLDFLANTINIYLVFNIFIVLVDANLYFSRYKNKIREVKPIVKFINELHTLNTTFKNKKSLNHDEFEQYSTQIYDKLTDNSVLNINHFRLKFGVDEGNKFFAYFDPNFSQNIEKIDFIRRHKSLILYSISLHKSLSANVNSIQNLEFITMLLAILPVSFMVLDLFSSSSKSTQGGDAKGAVKTTGIVAAGMAVGAMLIVPLKSVLEDIFYSFLYAYIVRPFDINDIIIIDKKCSRCLELGIFKSTFLTEGKYEIIETRSIGAQIISTLESTQAIKFTNTKKIKLNSFNKYNELRELIYEYLKFNPDMFRLKHDIYYLIEPNNVVITVEYDCICRYQEIEFANYCSKKFQTKFQDIIDTLAMETA